MANDDEFDTLAASAPDAPNGNADLEAIYDVPVTVSAVLGKASMQVSQLLKLGRGAVVTEQTWNLQVVGLRQACGRQTHAGEQRHQKDAR